VDERTLRGVVLKVDRFGNLITNFRPEDLPQLFKANPPSFKITAGKREITTLHSAYAEGAPGEVFAIIGSMGFVELSTNRGAAAQAVGSGKGTEVLVTMEGAAAAKNGS
jgi:S-adenosylmethionine hydrolase